MSIPKSVQRQAEEAERLMEQLSARETPPQTEPPEEPSEPEPPKLEEKKEPENPVPPAQDESALWKQRYETLRGKYDAEVGRVARENSELKSQLQQLAAEVGELKKPKQPEPVSTEPLIRPEDVENYGSDMIDLVKRAAKEIVREREAEQEKVIAELKGENARLKESLASVEQQQGRTAQERFFDRFAQLVPDWERINQDPVFLTWLEQLDQLTGQPRQILLDAAYNALDAQRVAAFFNAFKKESGRAAPSPAPTPEPNPQPTVRQPVPPEVARQVQPGRSKADTPPAAPDSARRIWTQKEIDTFYRDVALGKYRDHEDLRARTEAEIDLAAAEGRVHPKL